MFRKRRLCLYMLILLLIVIVASLYRAFQVPPPIPSKSVLVSEPVRPKLREIVSHVIRVSNFHYESLKKLTSLKLWPNTVIVSNAYFPTSGNNSVKFLHTDVDLMDPLQSRTVLDQIRTDYLLLSADFPKRVSLNDVKRALRSLKRYKEDLLIIPYDKESVKCLALKLSLREWTISYQRVDSDICAAVDGRFVLLTRAETLRKLKNPWLLPFPDALFLQSFAAGMKVRILKNVKLEMGFYSDQSRMLEQRYAMYEKFKVKKAVWDDRVEWYGCSRNTTRCFGTVFNDTPDFLYQGRWTPPCCLRVLRETARYVFRVLESHKVRYWLEGGTLLGAMRNADIIPWDYDVDVGAYREDLTRCPWIREIHKQIDRGVKFPRVEDKYGYVWELSRPEEGQFYRIQASRTNRLHVDVFPFYSKNGIMTKDTWMNHKQDREFQETFLKPMTKIPFVGVRVSAPNNIREFLELKFGPGCVENPEYPNPSILAFPKIVSTTTAAPDDY